MWQDKQSTLLREEIEAVLACLPVDTNYHNIVREPLVTSRRGLAIDSSEDRPWPLLPLIVCEALSGRCEQALPAAAALQFLMCAGDVFDDVEDADCPESLAAKYGPAIATNAATTLIMLAERAIIGLRKTGIDSDIVIRVMDSINSHYIIACFGQHLDLSLGSAERMSEELYMKIICSKSASQIECACHVGALLSTNNQELISKFSQFGQNLGMAAQIVNDIQGVTVGSDIAENKKSLPLVYALNNQTCKSHDQIKQLFRDIDRKVSNTASLRDLLFRSGAMHYATVKMEFFKQCATDILSDLKKAGVNVERLGVFLE
jgi:geranylgeranyl pyrophosphate synthase